MYPWLFEPWDCSREGDDDVDDETIDVGCIKKTLQSTTREAERGGERYGWGKGERTGRGGRQ